MDEKSQFCKSCKTRSGELKKCSQCKNAFYCSQECQKADWKNHKGGCKPSPSFPPLSNNTDHRGNKLSTQKMLSAMMNEDKASDEQTESAVTMMEQMSQYLPDQERRQVILDIPEFHKEYKEKYPPEQKHFKNLKRYFNDQKLWGIAATNLGPQEWNKGLYLRRYGELSTKLFEFLRNNPKFGDIFEPSYDAKFPKEKYQTIKNVPVTQSMFQRGETYVFVGFVDLFVLMMGQLSDGSSQKVRYVGYEMSEICVARSIVLYEMMSQEMDEQSILQVWFSTGWNDKTLKDFKVACRCVLDAGKIDNGEVKELIEHWVDASLSLRTAKEKWEAASVDGSIFHVAGNLCYKEDRVAYCRYCFTGQIFGASSQKHGNISMFSLSKSFCDYYPSSESVLATLSLMFFNYNGNLLESVENHIRNGLRNLMQWIEKGFVCCEFHVGELTPKNKRILADIRSLNPYHIDWSNIPDYFHKEDFIKMAQACSMDNTTHTAHFMNWSKYVYGTFILEYGARVPTLHSELNEEFEKKYQLAHSTGKIPFFFKDKYFVYPYNLSSDILARNERKRFLQYYFDVGGVEMEFGEVMEEPQSNFFQRTAQIFEIMFTFNTSLNLNVP